MVVSVPRRGTGRMPSSTFATGTVFVVSAASIAPHHPSNGQPRRPKEAPMMSASARRRIDPLAVALSPPWRVQAAPRPTTADPT